MKQLFLIGALALAGSTLLAQSSDYAAITETIMAFAKAGDGNDAKALAQCLDDNYRIVMNRMFGSQEVSVMPRVVYLEKIRTKEFGGDAREVRIEGIQINGNTATARVDMVGQQMTLASTMVLVKDTEAVWKIVSDVPTLPAAK